MEVEGLEKVAPIDAWDDAPVSVLLRGVLLAFDFT
jgi:hypothetical protein